MRIWYQNPSSSAGFEEFAMLLSRRIQQVSDDFGLEVDTGWIDQGRGEVHLYSAETYYRTLILKRLVEVEQDYDAVAIGCIFDPALLEARELLDIPVAGASESAMLYACSLGRKFSIITFSEKFAAKLNDQVNLYGLRDRLCSIEYRDEGMDDIGDAPKSLEELFTRLSAQAISKGAEVLIPGSTVTSAWLWNIGVKQVGGTPVVELISAAIQMAASLASLKRLDGLSTGTRGRYAVSRSEKSFIKELYRNLRV